MIFLLLLVFAGRVPARCSRLFGGAFATFLLRSESETPLSAALLGEDDFIAVTTA